MGEEAQGEPRDSEGLGHTRLQCPSHALSQGPLGPRPHLLNMPGHAHNGTSKPRPRPRIPKTTPTQSLGSEATPTTHAHAHTTKAISWPRPHTARPLGPRPLPRPLKEPSEARSTATMSTPLPQGPLELRPPPRPPPRTLWGHAHGSQGPRGRAPYPLLGPRHPGPRKLCPLTAQAYPLSPQDHAPSRRC